MSEAKLNIKEETSAKKTRSPPKKAKVEQTVPKKKKLKTDAEKAAEKAQHLRFGKAELTPDELSRLSKAQKREMYAAHAARSAVHREVEQYEDDNVGTQALSEGEKAAGNVRDISKSRYARKLKKKAKMQGKKGSKTAKSSVSEPTVAQDAGASGTSEGGSNWLSRWRQKQDIRQSYYAAARSGTAAQTAGGKAASNGASAARSGVEHAVEKGKTAVSTAVKGLMNAAKGNAHVLVIVGVFLLLILMVMSGFSSCGILFSGGTQVSGQTMYSAEDRDIRGAEQDYKKLEKELDKKIKRTPTDHPGYNEYQYHLNPIEHDPWQLTSFLTTLYDDYTRSEVQGKLKETFKKQYKLTTWVEVQIRYKTVWVISPAGIPVPTQVPYEYIQHFISLIRRCKNPTEISDSMFNELVDKIVVYEAEGAGNARTQKVDIYFNYVGQVDIAYTEEELAELKAQKEQEERQHMEKQRKREKAYREKRKAKKIAENGGEIIKTKTCPHCGKMFTPTSNRQLFCSRDCWNQARQEQKEAAREAERGGHYYRQRACAVCGHSYWPTHSQQEFCSEECRRINHNRKTLEFYHKKKGNPKPDPEAVPTPKSKEDNAA